MTKRISIAITIMLATAGVAAADKPTPDEAKVLLTGLRDRFWDASGPLTPAQRTATVAVLQAPLWYDGLTYYASDERAPEARACKKKLGKTGTVKDAAKLDGFAACLAIASFSGALDGDAEWTLADPKKLPKVFRKHKAKLAKLAKDHALVISQFTPAGPAEYWNLYVVARGTDGKPRLAGLVVVNIEYDVD